MGTYSIVPGGPHVADGLGPLAQEAEREGIGVVRTLVDRWIDGSERFDQPGERLLVAVAGGDVIGVGGLSRCPTVEGALRVRRFYVSPAWRRRGIARALAEPLVEAGLAHADLLTCNARASDAAAPFWERMGFTPSSVDGITHTLVARPPARR